LNCGPIKQENSKFGQDLWFTDFGRERERERERERDNDESETVKL